jgi:hypothetical protein
MLRKSCIACVMVAGLSLVVSVQQAQAQGRGRGGGGFGMGSQGVNDLMVATNQAPALEKELNIKPDQKEKLNDIRQDVREEFMSAMANAGIDRETPQEERAKKMAEVQKTVNDKFMPKLAEALDKDQLKRVHEIAIQAAGAHALLDASVQKELAISADQKDKLAAINKDFASKIQALPRGGDRTERMAKMHELSEEQLAKSTEVLNKTQQDQFASLKGKPFDTKVLAPARGGRGPGVRTRNRPAFKE